MVYNKKFLSSVEMAGFLNVFHCKNNEWRFCWCFLTSKYLICFDNLQEEQEYLKISMKTCLVCCSGALLIELHDRKTKTSSFIQSHKHSDIKMWNQKLQQCAMNCDINGKKRYKIFKLARTSAQSETNTIDNHQNNFKENNATIQNSVQLQPYSDHNALSNQNEIAVHCYRCKRYVDLDSVLSPDYQLKPSCIDCLHNEISSALKRSDYNFLHSNYTIQDLTELLDKHEFNEYLDLSLNQLLKKGDYFVECPNCASLWEFVHGDIANDAPDFSRMTGISNKLLDEEAKVHYLSHRLCCRQCGINFCRSCKTVPYHSGFNCEVYSIYKNAKKCRFCGVALMPDVKSTNPPSIALENVCNNESCLSKRDQTCTKTHEHCQHVCIGVRNETECISCIVDDCPMKPKYISQSLDDYCNICFTETLSEAPCIELDCGHIFHYHCLLQRISEKWNPPRITFGFMQCPLCNTKISHSLLNKSETVRAMQAIYRDLEQRSHFQLKDDGLIHCAEITEEKGDYYQNPIGYGMAKLAFYNCYVCNKPYYGGLVRCMDGLQNVDESDFICPACSGIGLDSCQVHGQDYIVYKCRFCCSVANYFCWGTTHFCHDCHKKQENHDFMTTKKKEELDQCSGPEKCPLRIDHPPNGEEFSLGCSLCRGSDSFFQSLAQKQKEKQSDQEE